MAPMRTSRILEIPYRRDLLPLHVAAPLDAPFLLETAGKAEQGSAVDILFALPGVQHTLASNMRVQRDGHAIPASFLDTLDAEFRQARLDPDTEIQGVPFAGGWFLYLGYELATEIETGLKVLPANDDFPVACAVRCGGAVVSDHRTRRSFLAAEPGALHKLEAWLQRIQDNCIAQCCEMAPALLSCREDNPQDYRDAVTRIVDYIHAGDVFQVNISRQWQTHTSARVQPWEIYQALRACNPAPFAGLARLAERYIVSSSPERLIRVCGKRIETRPIAGTRPRSTQRAIDQQLLRELHANPKERAEHLMLIDLERNDLGRLCEPGSISVDRFMGLESYTHVHHIVSDIHGRLRNGIGVADIIRAVFPGGTITGCPKVRCMEIITELEGKRRDAYTGSMGYLSLDGSMDLNILIRTMLMHKNMLAFRAGGGIVADSEPQQELEETRAKARGLLQSLNWKVDENAMVG